MAAKRYCKKCAEEIAARWSWRFDWLWRAWDICTGCGELELTYLAVGKG